MGHNVAHVGGIVVGKKKRKMKERQKEELRAQNRQCRILKEAISVVVVVDVGGGDVLLLQNATVNSAMSRNKQAFL